MLGQMEINMLVNLEMGTIVDKELCSLVMEINMSGSLNKMLLMEMALYTGQIVTGMRVSLLMICSMGTA